MRLETVRMSKQGQQKKGLRHPEKWQGFMEYLFFPVQYMFNISYNVHTS
jgi:hypothetical protein